MPSRHASPPQSELEEAAEALTRPGKNKKKISERAEALHPALEAEIVSLTPQEPLSPLETPPETQAALEASPAEAAPNSPTSPRKRITENSPPGGVITVDGVDFHHASEAEFARLLSYYGIEWEYEPHQFPLQWHEGRPTEMFSPDFYLPEYDLHIELTTMRQALVRRKNRKLRLLRALYPEVNVKLLYRRDYQRLLERFGIKMADMDLESPQPGQGPGFDGEGEE